MNEREIVKSYRQAKKKKHQIEILAELNETTRTEITKILIAAGEDVATSQQTQPEQEKEIEKAVEVDGVMEALFTSLDTLEKEIRSKEKQYEQICWFIQHYRG